MDFAHLHLHTEYSLLDGCCRIGRLFDAAAALGQKSIAITDHGVMYGVIDFYKEAKKHGIKPIIGCEVYVAPRSRFDKDKALDSGYSHLVLLCENNEGYQNLIKLVSAGFTDGFYSKPRVDRQLLSKYHSGLIALSACLAGEIPKALLNNDLDGAVKSAKWYDSVFGHGNFFLEFQDHSLPEQKRINPLIKEISKQTGIPLVATNDVHYIDSEDALMHKVLLCVQTGSKIDEPNPIEFKTQEFYLKSGEQMSQLFYDVPEAVENTVKIAERCNVEIEFGKIKLPFFDTGGVEHFEFFRAKCYEGLKRHYGEVPPDDVKKRLEYELSVINKMGYVDYYLIVWDFVDFAKRNGIPVGPGRGSGAGSLAAYCIGITGIDPIKYDLIFERFLNPERVSMPDFDIDFCYVNRQRVIDYVIEKYGNDRVAQIVTFGTLAARAAVRDVGRAMNIPYGLCDKVAKQIPQSLGMTLERALGISKELKTLYEGDEQVKQLVDMAVKVEGMPRHASTHAAGVVISDRPVSDYVPLALNDEATVTQYTMTALDELGLLKMDFLGLRNLTVIDDTQKAIRKRNKDFDIENIPVDDKKTFEMMSKGLSNGVFQFESDGMKNVLRQFCPESIEDLIAILSLYRPGPMDSIPRYIHNRHNPQDVTYLTPLLEPILRVTYGCIVYQEQVMQICRSLAGYSLGRADIVRRAMAKKKHDVMKKERTAFIYGEKDKDGNIICEGAVNRGVDEKAAEKIFDEMSAFSSYAFNKSHAAAYAVVAYRTAYLKCRYPSEYFAALLTSVLDRTDKISQYCSECKRLGIKVLPPSVNESFESFTATKDGIRFGLLAVKNLGRGIIDRLICEREQNGKYTSLYDFCSRIYGRDFNRRALEGLIKCGALDGLADNRRQMLFSSENVIEAVENELKFGGKDQFNMFSDEEDYNKGPVLADVEEMPEALLLAMEKEATGMYLSGHPVAAYSGFIKKGRYNSIADITSGRLKDSSRVKIVGILDGIRVRQTKNGSVMVSASVEDTTGRIDLMVFSSAYSAYREVFEDGNVVVVEGRISEREDQDAEIICEKALKIPESGQDAGIHNEKTVTDKTETGGENANEEKLYIRVDSMDSPQFSAVRRALEKYSGNCEVFIVCRDTNRRFKAPDRLNVSAESSLIFELKNILGEENVKIKAVNL